MNKSEILLEKMSALTINNPLGSTSKVLLTDKPLGISINKNLLSRGVESEIKKELGKVSKKIEPNVSFNLSNLLSKAQIKMLINNPNFKSFSKKFKGDISNVTV